MTIFQSLRIMLQEWSRSLPLTVASELDRFTCCCDIFGKKIVLRYPRFAVLQFWKLSFCQLLLHFIITCNWINVQRHQLFLLIYYEIIHQNHGSMKKKNLKHGFSLIPLMAPKHLNTHKVTQTLMVGQRWESATGTSCVGNGKRNLIRLCRSAIEQWQGGHLPLRCKADYS